MDQRNCKGGRPALIINFAKYDYEALTNTLISIPWGVEVTWALITPKNVKNVNVVQNIVLGCIYCKPNSKKKTALLDHIAQTYHFLSSKYGKGLYWCLAGDTNDLKLDPILSLSQSFTSMVKTPTRLNPDDILDNIIMDMPNWYQTPSCLPALDADEGTGGKASDHLIVLMKPISTFSNKSARSTREIRVRPMKQSGIELFKYWIKKNLSVRYFQQKLLMKRQWYCRICCVLSVKNFCRSNSEKSQLKISHSIRRG